MMRYVVAAAVAATFLAVPAVAQDLVPFSGARVEGLIGYDSVQVMGGANNGVMYGIGAGYDVHTGGTVLGIEAEFTGSEADECRTLTGSTFCSDVARDLYIGARAGVPVSANILIYAKGGYTNGRLKTDWENGVVGEDVSRNLDLNGFRVGAGAEFALGSNSYVKAEYRYSRYRQNDEFIGGTAATPVFLPGTHRTKNQLIAGFGFRF